MKDYYSKKDFINSPKYDAHIHYHTFDDLFVHKAKNNNLQLLSVNTNFDYMSIDEQFEISQSVFKRHPQTFNFLCCFDAKAFASKTFADDTIKHIKKCIAAGARGIKIWKNIGMALKTDAGQYVMADDPVFAPIFAFIEKEKIPLLIHLGDPRKYWLSFERKYQNPSYEQHIEVRDRILENYPDLVLIGAHLGCMEWSLEEVAKRLDSFPNFFIDISARLEYIHELTIRNRSQVFDFFETYQKRILYGSDFFVTQNYKWEWMILFYKCFPQVYMNLLFWWLFGKLKKHWLFLATDEVIKTKIMKSPKHVQGLKLSKIIVDNLFYKNACRVYLKAN